MSSTNRITICTCASRSLIDKEKAAKLAAVLQKGGYEVTVIPDLCEKVSEKSPDLPEIASSIVIACYPRAIRSLFHTAGVQPVRTADIRNEGVETILHQLGIAVVPVADEGPEETAFRRWIASFPVKTGRDAWYPVLDKERCTDCGECHDFCLFGVYAFENGIVTVDRPQNCKNDCPACARMCPNRAILFPKYEKSPINGGLEEEDAAVGIDMKAAYADAFRARLEQRRASVSLLKKDSR